MMNELKNTTKIEYLFFTVLLVFCSYGLFLGLTNMDRFLIFTQEDGLVENLTSLFLFGASVVCLYRVYEFRKNKKPVLWIFTAVLMAIAFFFAAGEEISWGQRIFGIESSEFFLQNNKQAETNLHNLVVGKTSINKLIFSQILVLVLVIYFFFMRLLVSKVAFIRNLEQKFNVPLPRVQHTAMMVLIAIMMAFIPNAKNAELLEMTFAFIFFLIFINPANID
ncbi:MAG: hypothetical protein ACK5JD_00675 [Mangrovibacterium sp.]